jgi:hypothetical protein
LNGGYDVTVLVHFPLYCPSFRCDLRVFVFVFFVVKNLDFNITSLWANITFFNEVLTQNIGRELLSFISADRHKISVEK